jgi:hypothetical protein
LIGSKKDEIKRKILSFIQGLRELKVEKAVIFGSRVKGNYLSTSDLDLMLISSAFKDQAFTDRINLVYDHYDLWKEPYPLEIICYTPEEFEKKKGQIGMARDAVNKGIVVEFI